MVSIQHVPVSVYIVFFFQEWKKKIVEYLFEVMQDFS